MSDLHFYTLENNNKAHSTIMFKTCIVTHFVILLLVFNLGALIVHLGFVVGCHKAEREALLKFKHSFTDNENSLPSWKGIDCCNWEGVGCNNVTSYVNRLDLHNPYYDPYSFSFRSFLVAPNLDPSLLELRHLNYLDLSCNDFQGSQIPGFIGSLEQLSHLNVSYSTFSGVVPSHLGNLSRLQNLDLSNNDLDFKDLHWAAALVSLRYLNMDNNNISHSLYGLSMLPSLLGLQLLGCRLGNPQLYSLFANSTWLSTIRQFDLSFNNFEGPLPSVFPNMTSLTYLDLSQNNFNGSIPLSLRNMRKLEHLDLGYNSFRGVEGGGIIGVLGNLCKLRSLYLSYNSIGGGMGVHWNFSKCIKYDFEILDLGSTMIGGTLPNWLGDFKNMRHLDISDNSITGPIPASIGSLVYLEELILSKNNFTSIPKSIENLSHLEKLDLSHNTLNGTIPEGLGQCKSLVSIDLSSNFLKGEVSESHLGSLSRLDYLDLSFISLHLNLSSNWTPPFQLRELHLVSCKIQPQIPLWVRTQTTKLSVLDLSYNIMSGELLDCFPSIQLIEINLSHNNFTGLVPCFSSSLLRIIDLSYNSFSGPLIHPSVKKVGNSLCELPGLFVLDLQNNKLSGSISDCWGNSTNSLETIDLSYNDFSGNIPMSLGLFRDLEVLNLGNNALEGPVPTLNNCTQLTILDLSENKLFGKIPSWGAESHPWLTILRLRTNQFVGVIPPQLCSLPYLQILDLGDNKLIGNIPPCVGHIIGMGSSAQPFATYRTTDLPFVALQVKGTVVLKGEVLEYSKTLRFVVNLDLSCNDLTGTIPFEVTNLSALVGLNLSHNHLKGNIPTKIGEMRSLESLDLSYNNLSGTIPASISALTSIVRLNLSYNQLHGQIPTGHQLQVIEDPSMTYIGNPGLCGDPLLNKCNPIKDENQPTQEEPRNEEIWENPLFYFVIFSGFATGFWGIVGSLLLKRRFNCALFQLVGNIADYLYVQVMVRVNRLRN